MVSDLSRQRALAVMYGMTVIPRNDILSFEFVNNDQKFSIWYTTYSRGITPWAVARVTTIPKGERGEGQPMFEDHQYFAELEDAFIYAIGETLRIDDNEDWTEEDRRKYGDYMSDSKPIVDVEADGTVIEHVIEPRSYSDFTLLD